MKLTELILSAAMLASPGLAGGEETRIDQLRSVIKSSCEERGIKVSFAASEYLGVHTLVPHIHGDDKPEGDPAWRIYEASLQSIADWAGRGEGRRSANLPPNDGLEHPAPTKKSDARHSFRVGTRDLVGVVYLKTSEGESPGSLIFYLVDGAKYAENEDLPRPDRGIEEAEQ